MKMHGYPHPKRRQSANFELSYEQAQALHIALIEYLRHSIGEVTICGELVTGKYSPNSQLDQTVRLAIRVNRYLLGGKHYNHRIAYDLAALAGGDSKL